jgi:hypothetical protein
LLGLTLILSCFCVILYSHPCRVPFFCLGGVRYHTHTHTHKQTGAFANYHLWVTPHSDTERYPAGEYTVQGTGSNGLPDWTAANRNIVGEDIVLWHAFGVTHVPRPEDFPVMPCEVTGFTLKPDGFFEGNPAIDIQPEVNKASTLTADSSGGCCGTTTTTPTA